MLRDSFVPESQGPLLVNHLPERLLAMAWRERLVMATPSPFVIAQPEKLNFDAS
jgi:hypothetical protein